MAARVKKTDYLRTVPLFRDLTGSQLNKIARVADRIEVRPGHEIVREGTYRSGGTPSFFVVADGRADVIKARKRIARLSEGDSFGEMSLLDGKPRVATVTARTPMTLYRIRSFDFLRLVRSEPMIALGLLKTVADRLRAYEEKTGPKRVR